MQSAISEAQVKPSVAQRAAPRRLYVLFVLASFATSLAVLSCRNIYDDEITSLNLVTAPIRQIVRTANSDDVHPPGMYVLAHLAWLAIPSPRWMTIVPLILLYAGVAFFVSAVCRYAGNWTARLTLLTLATFHPQLLMWGNSIRWYSWWTGLALLTLTLALQLSRADDPPLSTARAAITGILLAALFYINYITLLFVVALGCAMLARYSGRFWKKYLLVCVVFAALITPQLHASFFVHLPGSGDQRSGVLASALRLIQGISVSEALLPWHPVAILGGVVFLLAGVTGAVLVVRHPEMVQQLSGSLRSITTFAIIFLLLVAVSGLGGRPRNGLLLTVVMAPPIAATVGSLRWRWTRFGFPAIFAVVSVFGIAHLLMREGITKASMNDHPEEVLRFVEASHRTACAIVVTYDQALSFYLATHPVAGVLPLVNQQNALYHDTPRISPQTCSAVQLYVVQSFIGGIPWNTEQVLAQSREAVRLIEPPVAVNRFSFDPDAKLKRRLPMPLASSLPDYRYVVRSGRIPVEEIGSLEKTLSEFVVPDGAERAH